MVNSDQVSKRRSNVVQLPSELNRLRSADRLIQEWLKIQEVDDSQAKLLALVTWRQQLKRFKDRFGVG